MKHLTLILLFLLLITPSLAQQKTSLFASSPKGWRPETIPFPLKFAPTITYQGLEELRFAPGMFRPLEPDFFTYAFIWRLDGTVDLSPKPLQQNLLLYFQGLYSAVSKTKQADTDRFSVKITDPPKSTDAQPDKTATNQTLHHATVKWVDPFRTEKPTTLNMNITTWPCDNHNKTWALFLVSPQPRDHKIWQTLATLRPLPCE